MFTRLAVYFPVELIDERLDHIGVHQVMPETIENPGFEIVPPHGQQIVTGSLVVGGGAPIVGLADLGEAAAACSALDMSYSPEIGQVERAVIRHRLPGRDVTISMVPTALMGAAGRKHTAGPPGNGEGRTAGGACQPASCRPIALVRFPPGAPGSFAAFARAKLRRPSGSGFCPKILATNLTGQDNHGSHHG